MSIGSMLVRHEPESAAVVRHEIAADLRGQGLTPGCIQDVSLVVTELVTNAVVHSAAGALRDLGVAWDVERDLVTVRVEDHSRQRPRPRSADSRATSGRGLAIVAAVACEWGVTRTDEGKQVWACVPAVRATSHRQTA